MTCEEQEIEEEKCGFEAQPLCLSAGQPWTRHLTSELHVLHLHLEAKIPSLPISWGHGRAHRNQRCENALKSIICLHK